MQTSLKRGSLFVGSLFFILIFFTSNSITTGDSGELVTAMWQLGTSHSPGYILYSMLGKLFTLIPFGNIASRAALFSVFFSFLSVVLVLYLFDLEEKFPVYVKLFFAFFLMQSYSFFMNTVYIKFYTFVGFFVVLLFVLGFLYLKTSSRKYEFIGAFVLGISLFVHNICVLMIVPLLFSVIVVNYKRPFLLIKKILLDSFIVLFSAFFTSVYYFIVSMKPGTFSYSRVFGFYDLYAALMRKVYYGGNTHVVESSFGSVLNGKLYFLYNVTSLFLKEFHLWGLLFFVSGALYLFAKSKKGFFYFFLAFFMYSYVLGLFTFNLPRGALTPLKWMVIGNQYFVSSLLIFGAIASFGFWALLSFLVRAGNGSSVIKYSIVGFSLIVPLIYLPGRFIDCNFSTNDVAFAKTKDMLITPPLDSILIVTGDNNAFQSWYYRRVLDYRSDLCVLSMKNMKNFRTFLMYGCPNRATPKNMNLVDLARKGDLYVDVPFEENKTFKHVFTSVPYGMIYMALPAGVKEPHLGASVKKFMHIYNYEVCDYNTTDDPLTKELCGRYAVYLMWLIKSLAPKHGKMVKFEYFVDDLKRVEWVKIGKSNEKLFEELRKITFKSEKFKFYLFSE